MCLILFSYKNHPEYKLIVAANRDEFYERPTIKANFWDGYQEILGGRDLIGKGTWMGITKAGRLSMITNYRDPENIKEKAPSRGNLVADYLKNSLQPKEYLEKIDKVSHVYNGFNLLLGSHEDLWFYSNQQGKLYQLGSGFYGLSNALLDTPWPKVEKGKKDFSDLIARDFNAESLLDLLYNDLPADDNLLPDTGVGKEKERMLSSIFIKSPNYGSRCSTVITIDFNNKVQFSERTYDLSTFKYTTVNYDFIIEDLDS